MKLFATYTVATLQLDFAGTRQVEGAAVASTQISINDESLHLGAAATLGVQQEPTPGIISPRPGFSPSSSSPVRIA